MNKENNAKRVGVGLGIIIIKNGMVLVGIRKGSHAAGLYSFPGGHLEFGETYESCVYREVAEECGESFKVRVRNFSEDQEEFFVANSIMTKYNKHYITIFMVADWIEGEPINSEPDKCEGWSWVSLETLEKLAEKTTADWIPFDRIKSNSAAIGLD